MGKPQAFPGLRRNPLGLGLLFFYLALLALLAYGLHSLYGRITSKLP